MGNIWLDRRDNATELSTEEKQWVEDTFSKLALYCAWQKSVRVKDLDFKRYQLDLMKAAFKSAVVFKRYYGLFTMDEKMVSRLKNAMWKHHRM